MFSSDEKIIELSKAKLLLMVFGCFAFIGAGAWLVFLDATQIQAFPQFNSPLLIHSIGWAGIVFFGLCGVIWIKKALEKIPGLIFNRVGLTDNSSGLVAGLVPWTEISGFEVYQIGTQKMIIVLLKNPDKYIEVGGAVRRKLNRANYKMCGSPICITSSSLKVSHADLLRICNEYFAKYGNSA